MSELDPAVAPLHHRLHLAALHHDPLPLTDRLTGPLDRLRFDPPAGVMLGRASTVFIKSAKFLDTVPVNFTQPPLLRYLLI